MSERDLQASCTRRLSGHKLVAPADALAALANHPAATEPADVYGAGGALGQLEKRTAELLGKPAAMFFIKGMMAQMSVLRVAADRARTPNVVIHPMSHIDFDEQDALFHLHPVQPIRIGRYAPFTLAQLEALTEPLAAIVIELPLRRSGYHLPPLEELRAISAWARGRGVHLHFDGARIWEAAAGYGVPLAELAALADSVYVSFYKGLGGLGGAAVAGEQSFIRALDVWRIRHAGNLYTVFPNAISALRGLDEQLPRMPTYVERARNLANRLSGDAHIAITPKIPDVNSFHLLLSGSVDELTAARDAFANERGIWLFNAFFESPVDGRSIAEVVIGDNSEDYGLDEAASWIGDFLANR